MEKYIAFCFIFLFNFYHFKILKKFFNCDIMVLTEGFMRKISEFKSSKLIFNHIVYDKESERHFAMHSHSLMEFIYITKGEVAYTVEDKKFTARQGELLVIKPYAYHYFTIKNQQDYEKIGVLCNCEDLEIEYTMNEPLMLIQCQNGRLHDIFNKIDFYYHNCPQPIFKELLKDLAKEILINIKFFSYQYVISTRTESIHPLIERAINYINENLFNFNTVKELANHLSVSESHLKVLFTSQLKVTPKNYITEKKMLFARSMISNGTTPTQTAFHCRYSNYATFYRLYLRFFNVNPMTDYKNNNL